jgi:NAD(P)-dependent dehydrogenase (short-subunit alcohol dehydrogenase family)
MTDDNLLGRSAIVTGGGSGIGRAIVLELAAAGANILIAGRRPEALNETARLSESSSRLIAFPADIREPMDRARIVAAAAEQLGGLDVLVNNAGVTSLTPLLDYSVDEWRNVMATHAEAALVHGYADAVS